MPQGLLKRVVQIFASLLLFGGGFFAAAGRLDWTMAWVMLGLYVLAVAATFVVVIRTCPDLIAERARIGEGAKNWDKVLAFVVGLAGPLATWVVAGLDVRYGWTAPIAPAVQIAAVCVAALGYAFMAWATASNRFFSAVVRIQKDRGHVVVSGGPYQYIRHPGYAGLSLITFAIPLVLGSARALIPAALTEAALLLRIVLEDRMLHQELDGYRAYAARVRYRLVPWIW